MPTESATNKKQLLGCAIAILVIALIVILLPLFGVQINYKDSISYAGSFASLAAIFVTLYQVWGLSQSNEAIKKEITKNNEDINKLLTVADIAGHVRMVAEAKAYVNNSKWEAAHIRMSDILQILEKLEAEFGRYNLSRTKIMECLYDLNEDLRSLNAAMLSLGSVDALVVANHLDAVTPLLNKANNHLQKITND